MDMQGFRSYLQAFKASQEQIEASLAIASRFDVYLHEPGSELGVQAATEFSRRMIVEGENSEENYIALVRYSRFIKDNELFVAFLELVDGAEVAGNLYRWVGEQFGVDVRDEAFAGAGIIPYGTPTAEKAAYLQPIIQRLEARVGAERCKAFLSASLRDLPDEYFHDEREMFQQAASIDDFLRLRKEAFVAVLEKCMREGRLFFSQEITPEVIEFVRGDPEIGGGRREGNIVYETKIPYQTVQYLAESDPLLKRYDACHCPWAREAIKTGNVKLAEVFCQCSGGYHKKPFEVALGQPVRVEVLESAIKGDARCRFAIYLPENA